MKSGRTGSFFVQLIEMTIGSTPYFNLKGIALFLTIIVCSLPNMHEVKMCNKFLKWSNDAIVLRTLGRYEEILSRFINDR